MLVVSRFKSVASFVPIRIGPFCPLFKISPTPPTPEQLPDVKQIVPVASGMVIVRSDPNEAVTILAVLDEPSLTIIVPASEPLPIVTEPADSSTNKLALATVVSPITKSSEVAVKYVNVPASVNKLLPPPPHAPKLSAPPPSPFTQSPFEP